MEFKGEYDFLSNMYPCNIEMYIGPTLYTFSCAETAFQACKDPSRVTEFLNFNGYEAKKLGRQVQLPSDWEEKKINIMKLVVKLKFDQNQLLRIRLAQIEGDITEDNTWNDTFWGVVNGIGENHLGKILMEYRKDIKMSKVCCFTGRRPKDLYGYKKEPYIPLVNKLKEDIVMLYNQGYTQFISGGAQGFDQLAFWAVNAVKRDLHLPIQNIIYIPFKGQELAWKETGLFSQKEYNLMISLADKVAYLNWNAGYLYYLPDNFKVIAIDEFEKLEADISYYKVIVKINTSERKQVYIPTKEVSGQCYIPVVDTTNTKGIITKALHDRNHSMVNVSDLVYGLYPDYSWIMPQVKGGTAECLKYAVSKNKKIYQLSNETLRSAEYKY